MAAAFRTLCHSLGLSAQALAGLAGVQERSVRHWWADGQPPGGVLAMVMQIDEDISRLTESTVVRAEKAAEESGDPLAIDLAAWRTEAAWWAAHPEFKGLPIQTHGVMLRRVWEALQGLGYEVRIEWTPSSSAP